MKGIGLLLSLVFVGSLFIFSQALAAGQTREGGAQTTAEQNSVQHSVQLQQWERDQEQMQARVETRQLTGEQAMEMQRLLKHRGYSVSYQDGIIGNETMAALSNFQSDNGLTVTGMPNHETLNALVLSTPQYEFFGLAPEFGDDVE